MTFTVKNLLTEFPKLEKSVQQKYSQHFELAKKIIDKYYTSDTAKNSIDMLLNRLNRYAKETPKKEKSVSVEKKPKAPKPKKERPTYAGSYVEKIQPSVSFIKRYTHLHGKTISEAKDSAIRLLSSLQKAIVEKQIRKSDTYADDIMKMQDTLIKISEMRKSDTAINITDIERLREIAKTQRVSDSVAIIKQFLSIQGKEGVKDKAKSLLEKINKIGLNDRTDAVVTIKGALYDYIDGKTPTPEADTQTLQGLYGLAGVEYTPQKSGTSVQSTQFLGATFDTLNFTGKWANFIGKPDRNFKIMIFGKAGSGKSTFALKFAYYLASDIGLRVLYVAGEEKLGYTLHEKIVRLGISSPNLYINDVLPKDLSKYDVAFIDSVNTFNLEPSDLERLPKNKAYAYIFQCTKDGNYRGSQAFEHNADAVIECENMTARMGKNRFGGKEKEFKV